MCNSGKEPKASIGVLIHTASLEISIFTVGSLNCFRYAANWLAGGTQFFFLTQIELSLPKEARNLLNLNYRRGYYKSSLMSF